MKLRDLRELYEAPKDDIDDLDGEEAPEVSAAPDQTFIGVDLAHGPDKFVVTFVCDRCNAIVRLPDMPQKAVIAALCPKCDGCVTCGKLYDEKGDPAPLKSATAIGIVDGELVHKRCKICEGCVFTEKARRLGYVVTDDPIEGEDDYKD
jgi:hypothetical protein